MIPGQNMTKQTVKVLGRLKRRNNSVALVGSIPRRCVNLPPGTLRTLLDCLVGGKVEQGTAIEEFPRKFAAWLGAPHVFGTGSGRSAFQLALEALDMEKGKEIIFPVFTFPVMPMLAKMLGYQPVFCDVDPDTLNMSPEHVERKITGRTVAVLATHLFGRPCPIREIAALLKGRNIRLLEDCAHACGVRVEGRQVGTFGDVGVFSFAEGKNMPCLGGGAIATADGEIARRAGEILSQAPIPPRGAVLKKALSIWLKWLLTRPSVFGLTAYPVLRLKLSRGQPLMDSSVGDELLEAFAGSRLRVDRLANLQAAIGLRHLPGIDSFNQGARRNAQILSEKLAGVPGVGVPPLDGNSHIYVYYPLTVEPARRDDLRRYLLRHGIDTKTSDMSDCSRLKPFRAGRQTAEKESAPPEASILEVCVYPIIPEKQFRRLAQLIQAWAKHGSSGVG
jgi:dTDP-4-amino-4,6-dideoxygalactose transaminase